MQLTKIVLTGGPCAGKTTGMSWIVDNFEKLGYKVLVASEAATELINGGAKPWEVKDVDFQMSQYQMVKSKEESYENFARASKFEKVLIVCDRGTLDAEAYLSEESKLEWHKKIGLSRIEMMEEYDAVFHLVTAAKGAEEYYTKSNNKARIETVEEAIDADTRTLNAWTGHNHLRIIDNSTDFNTKMLRLIKEISSFLGEPEPFEIEKKFLIEYPDISKLEKLKNCQKVEILQTYLLCDTLDEEVRIRQRGDGDTFQFTKTTKRRITGLKRIELEKKLNMSEYIKELLNTDYSLHQIRKTRYCISYKNTYLELDVYPFWKDKAILEIELSHEDDKYNIPKFIKVLEDVTDNEQYKNHNIAKLDF